MWCDLRFRVSDAKKNNRRTRDLNANISSYGRRSIAIRKIDQTQIELCVQSFSVRLFSRHIVASLRSNFSATIVNLIPVAVPSIAAASVQFFVYCSVHLSNLLRSYLASDHRFIAVCGFSWRLSLAGARMVCGRDLCVCGIHRERIIEANFQKFMNSICALKSHMIRIRRYNALWIVAFIVRRHCEQ